MKYSNKCKKRERYSMKRNLDRGVTVSRVGVAGTERLFYKNIGKILKRNIIPMNFVVRARRDSYKRNLEIFGVYFFDAVCGNTVLLF